VIKRIYFEGLVVVVSSAYHGSTLSITKEGNSVLFNRRVIQAHVRLYVDHMEVGFTTTYAISVYHH
jgi:hypothetical protein